MQTEIDEKGMNKGITRNYWRNCVETGYNVRIEMRKTLKKMA